MVGNSDYSWFGLVWLFKTESYVSKAGFEILILLPPLHSAAIPGVPDHAPLTTTVKQLSLVHEFI